MPGAARSVRVDPYRTAEIGDTAAKVPDVVTRLPYDQGSDASQRNLFRRFPQRCPGAVQPLLIDGDADVRSRQNERSE